MDEGQEIPCCFVITCGDASEMLEAIDKAFHQVPAAILASQQASGYGASGPRGDHGSTAAEPNFSEQGVAVIALVRDQVARPVVGQQTGSLRYIMILSGRNHQLHRPAGRFDGDVLTLSDMTLMGSGAARSGALVTTKCSTENITRCLFSTYYNGIIALGNVGLIRDCSWQQPQSGCSNGIIVDGYAGGMTMDNVVMYVPNVTPESGIKALSCGALQMANSNIMKQNVDLLISPPAGRGVFSVNAINTFFDTATTGINIAPRGGVVARCSFTQCWASSHVKNGVSIGGTGMVDGIQFIGLQVNFCGENGISIETPAKNIMVEGGEGVHNKMAAINIGDHVKGVMVNHFFGGAGFGGSGPDYGNDYGIVIGKGCDNYQIANCHLLGNRSGALLDQSFSAAINKIVVNNMV